MPVNRRSVLATASLGLSTLSTGCRDGLPGFSGSQNARVVSVRDVDPVGDDHPVVFDVTQSTKAMGDGSMPAVELVLENTGSNALFLSYRGSWPEAGLLIERNSDPGGLRLLGASEVSGVTVESGRCPSTDFNPAAEASIAGHRVAPDRRHRVSYRVLASARDLEQDCPPVGRYHWRSSYQYAPATAVESVGWENADRIRFEWGFSLEVKAPEAG